MTGAAQSHSAPTLDPSALRHTGAARRVDKSLPLAWQCAIHLRWFFGMM